jgi:hypothetical protein
MHAYRDAPKGAGGAMPSPDSLRLDRTPQEVRPWR